MAHLLVVEDNPDILHLIWTQMRARGHQVLGASSGPEALAAVELWGPPQVAVLDVAMPSMDGLELLEQLRAATGMPELPAIFLSARVDRQTVEAAHRLGAAYLAKPFMEEILYAAIEAALSNGYEGLWTAVEDSAPGANREENVRVGTTPWAPQGVRKEGAPMAMPTLADWSLGTTIPAKDLDGTRRFYEDVLGAQVVMEDPGGIMYRSGDSYFSLYPTEFAGTAQHTLAAFMVGDVEAAVADLRGRGVTFEEYDLPGVKTVNGIAELGGMKGAWFKDPEGNILSVVQPPAH